METTLTIEVTRDIVETEIDKVITEMTDITMSKELKMEK